MSLFGVGAWEGGGVEVGVGREPKMGLSNHWTQKAMLCL